MLGHGARHVDLIFASPRTSSIAIETSRVGVAREERGNILEADLLAGRSLPRARRKASRVSGAGRPRSRRDRR